MRRRAFILTDILTGMMLQSIFALTLCGAFYMLLSFSTSTQQILAAHDEGQIVISYINTRIKNAGVGLWACETPKGICEALENVAQIQGFALPVAITESKLSKDVVSEDGVYKGNNLMLLYAHKDPITASGLVVLTDGMEPTSVDNVDSNTKNYFKLLGSSTAYTSSNFGKTEHTKYVRNYAAIESSGLPVYLKGKGTSKKDIKIFAPSSSRSSGTIYPMSELLNLECERMYVGMSTGEHSFMIETISEDKWNSPTPHTKGILEIYMELNTNPDVPIFDLKVLVSEGRSDSPTPKPQDWPDEYWDYDNDHMFSEHKVHVSRASWRLYNLVPFFKHH